MDEKKGSRTQVPRRVMGTLKFLVCLCALLGLAFLVTVAMASSGKYAFSSFKYRCFTVFSVAFGLILLSLSITVAIHLMRRSARSRKMVRICCMAAPLCMAPASLALIPLGFGPYAITYTGMVAALARAAHDLIEKRLEVGDDRPLVPMPGVGGRIRWGKFLLACALAYLASLVIYSIVTGAPPWDNSDVAKEGKVRVENSAQRDAQIGDNSDYLRSALSHSFPSGEGETE